MTKINLTRRIYALALAAAVFTPFAMATMTQAAQIVA
jgi:hypothetical protein